MKLLRALLVVGFAMGGLSLDVSAQSVPSPVGGQLPDYQVPIIQVESNEVSLDIVVRDKRTKEPVLDLRPGDISITDDGKSVKLTSLRLVTSATPDERLAAGPTAGEDLVTLVFDHLNSGVIPYEREDAENFLRAYPEGKFRFAVTAIDSRLRLVQDFTADRDRVARAVEAATRTDAGTPPESATAEKSLISLVQTGVDSAGGPVGEQDRDRSQGMLRALLASQRIVKNDHAEPSLASIQALAEAQKSLRGRRIILYFTAGYSLADIQDYRMKAIVNAASQTGVSIYVVDYKGLDAQNAGKLAYAIERNKPNSPLNAGLGSKLTDSQKKVLNMAALGSASNLLRQFQWKTDGGSALDQMAVDTGGGYLGAAGLSRKMLRDLIAEATTYYQATYVPVDAGLDGRFHPVLVKPVRAGLVVHTRAGYLSKPSGEGMAPIGFEAPLLKVLSGPELPSEVGFRASVLSLGARSPGDGGEVVVEVPVANLEMRKDTLTNRYSVHPAVAVEIRNAAGQLVNYFSEDLARSGALDDPETGSCQVITLQKRIIAPPGAYTLKVALVDLHRGALGTQKTSFVLDGAQTAPSLGGPVLVRGTENLTADDDLLEPLRYGGERVIPDLSGRLPAQSKAVRLFFVAHADPNAPETPKASLRLLKDGKLVSESPVAFAGSEKGDIAYLGALQTRSYPPGRYELQAMVAQAGKSAMRSVDFTIEGP